MSRHRAAGPLLFCASLALIASSGVADAQFFPRDDSRSAVDDEVEGTRRAFPTPAVEAPRSETLPWLRRSPVTSIERDDRLIFRRIDEEEAERAQQVFDPSERIDGTADGSQARFGEDDVDQFGRPRTDDNARDRRARRSRDDTGDGLDGEDVLDAAATVAFPLPDGLSDAPRTDRTGSVLPPRDDPPVQAEISRLDPPDIFPSPTSADPDADLDDTDPTATDDGFDDDGLGLDVGSFRLFPAIEFRAGGSIDTEDSLNQEAGSLFGQVSPELRFETLWDRHSIDGELRGTFTRFQDEDDDDDIDADGRITGRLDILSRSSLTLEGTYDIDRVSGGDVGAPDNAQERPFLQTIGGEATLDHRWNRFSARLRGAVTQFIFGDAEDENGDTVDNSALDHRIDAAELRLAYEYSPKTEVFVEGEIDRDVYDDSDQGSTGQRLQVGAVWRPSALLEVSVAGGVDRRDPDLDGADDVVGLALDGTITWQPSALTTVTLRGSQETDVTNEEDATAVSVTSGEITLEHALTRFLQFRGGVLYDINDFSGIDREDRRLSLTAGVSYEFNRHVLFVADVAYIDVDSTDDDEVSSDAEYSAGVRIRY
ncbi:MAG: outer membrane beta-barrel protein [Pseudomonadota bacterium]